MRLLGSVIFVLALGLLFSVSQAAAIVSFTNTQRLDVDIDTTVGPQTIVLADLNRDGQADIVALNQTAASVDIFLNDGNGTFPTTPVTLPEEDLSADITADPVAVATGDFNHDGKVDLLIVNGDSSYLTIWFGSGDGKFSSFTKYAVNDPQAPDFPPTLSGVVIADLDGDTIDDVALLGTDANGDDRIYVLKSLGASRTFTPFAVPSVLTGGQGGFAIGAARFRGPSSPVDLVTSNGDSGDASVLLGKGDGTFAFASISPGIGDQPAGLTIADLNNDGILDVAIVDAGANADENVSLLFGDGTGHFNNGAGGNSTTHATTTAEVNSTAVAAADVDLNGEIDLVVTNIRDGGGEFAVLCQPSALCDDSRVQAESGFKLLPAMGTSLGEGQVGVLAGRINQDIAPDVIVLGEDGKVLGVFIDTTLPNPAFGICNTNDAGQTPIEGSPVAVALADFDRDPDQSLDIAVADNTGNKIDVLLSHLDPAAADVCGAFGLQRGADITDVTAPVALVTSDIDRDGRSDLAVVGADGLSVFFGDGNGGFTAASGNPMVAGTTPQSLAVGDFNHDGLPDIIVANEDSRDVSLFLASGPRAFQQPPCPPVTVGAKATFVVAQDFNLDGQLDFAVASDEFNGDVYVFLQTAPTPGTATQGACPTFNLLGETLMSGPPRAMVAGQFDPSDTVPDLLVATASGASNGQLLTFLGTAVSGGVTYPGTPTRTANIPGSNIALSALAVGDFDFGDFHQDGRLDAVVTDRNNNNVIVFFAGTDGSFQVPISPSSIRGVAPVGLAVGDIDGDGRLDIVVANRGNGVSTGSLTILTSSHLPTPTASPILPPTDTPTATSTVPPTVTPTPSATETALPTQTSPPTSTPTHTRIPTLTATPLATDTPRGKIALNGACAVTAPGDDADRTVTALWAAILALALARRYRAAGPSRRPPDTQ